LIIKHASFLLLFNPFSNISQSSKFLIFFGVPHLSTFISISVSTHDLLVIRHLPKPAVLNLGYVRSPQGYTKFKKPPPNEAHLGRIFYLEVHKGDTILIWGYAEWYNFDLGVCKYQKIENPWPKPLDYCNNSIFCNF
jgi:hypothetical protein